MSRPPVVVLGASGMLGHKLFQRLRERFPGTLGVMRGDPARPPYDRVGLLGGDDVLHGVDVADFDGLHGLLRELRPDFVVNAVGVIKQREAASSAIPCITINALLPHRLAESAAGWGGRVVHFSTDCVFSGKRGGYAEDDPSDAEDLYGKSKFLGEVATENALTLRTSIIGRELTGHRSLLDWFLSRNHGTVKGYRRAIYSGITTNEMAEVVTRVMRGFPSLSGLYHVVSEPIAKYDLLGLVRDAYGLDIRIEPDDADATDRSMKGDRFGAATGYASPSWPELVDNLAADPTPYDEWVTS